MDFDINKDKIEYVKDGKKVECDILFTFNSEDTMKTYIGYTDHSVGPNGRVNIFVSSYSQLLKEPILEDVTDQRELEMVQRVLEKISDGTYE